jgi:short-subunit dehydrogenase
LFPHFNSLPNGGVIMNVPSVLGYNPFSLLNAVYNGSKTWVQLFLL